MTCPLCEHKIITEEPYEDEVCWVARCASHRNKWIIVLKRHVSNPTYEECKHMVQVALRLFPNIILRGPATIKDHFHLHEV